MNLVKLCVLACTITFVLGSNLKEDTDRYMEKITAEASCQGYEQGFTKLIEMIYGKGYLSLGGDESVQEMIQGLDLTGKRVLDIGSGLGGPCIYLAKSYAAEIIGLEPQKWMVELSQKNLSEVSTELKGSVDFVLMEETSNLRCFPDNSFDVILSKEVLLHIPTVAKQGFYKEIYRVLKPGGHIVLMDWLCVGSLFGDTQKN